MRLHNEFCYSISHNLRKIYAHKFSGPAHPTEEKEVAVMNCHANKSIECTVHQCSHHCGSENYCSLDRILVGTHESDPTVDQCTDCMSFHRK